MTVFAVSIFNSHTDHLQIIEDYVKGCKLQLKRVNTISNFHKLLFDREDSSLACFHRGTQPWFARGIVLIRLSSKPV